MVAISVDPTADSLALREQLGLGFPLLFDADAEVARAYGVAMDGQALAVPAVFIVRPDRTIAWKYVGEAASDRPPERELLDQLDSLDRLDQLDQGAK